MSGVLQELNVSEAHVLEPMLSSLDQGASQVERHLEGAQMGQTALRKQLSETEEELHLARRQLEGLSSKEAQVKELQVQLERLEAAREDAEDRLRDLGREHGRAETQIKSTVGYFQLSDFPTSPPVLVWRAFFLLRCCHDCSLRGCGCCCFSLTLSFSVPTYTVCICLCLCVFLSVCVSFFVHVCLCVCVFACFSICLSLPSMILCSAFSATGSGDCGAQEAQRASGSPVR